MKTLYLFLKMIAILILMIECSQPHSITKESMEQIYGQYVYSRKEFSIKLVLTDDGKFKFEQLVGSLYNPQSMGNWFYEDGFIVLHSDSLFFTGKIDVDEIRVDSLQQARFEVFFNPQICLENAFILLDGDSTKSLITNEKGIAYSQNLVFNYFSVNYMGDKYEYQRKYKKSNLFTIKIQPIDIQKQFFKGEKFKIMKNKIDFKPYLQTSFLRKL